MDEGMQVVGAVGELSAPFNQNVSLECYNGILSMLLNGAPLAEILHALVLKIEDQRLGTHASVLLLSEDGKRVLMGAAPHLPDSYNQAIHGVEIGPEAGSCGTAAYTGERVIVEDIEHHPYWALYKSYALVHGLRACWSEPIKDSQGKVLGTFAMYYKAIKAPTAADLTLIAEAARLASLAIERSRSLEFQRLAVKIFDRLPLALVITNAKHSVLYANDAFKQMVWPQIDNIQDFNPEQIFSPSEPHEIASLFKLS